MDNPDRKEAALRFFRLGYAIILDEPETERVVQQLALMAVDSADAGRQVLRFGWGQLRAVVAEYQYIRPVALLEGRDARKKKE